MYIRSMQRDVRIMYPQSGYKNYLHTHNYRNMHVLGHFEIELNVSAWNLVKAQHTALQSVTKYNFQCSDYYNINVHQRCKAELLLLPFIFCISFAFNDTKIGINTVSSIVLMYIVARTGTLYVLDPNGPRSRSWKRMVHSESPGNYAYLSLNLTLL